MFSANADLPDDLDMGEKEQAETDVKTGEKGEAAPDGTREGGTMPKAGSTFVT